MHTETNSVFSVGQTSNGKVKPPRYSLNKQSWLTMQANHDLTTKTKVLRDIEKFLVEEKKDPCLK